jgi:hypothetical protein
MAAFWDVTSCSLVEVNRRFRGACCPIIRTAMEAVSTPLSSVNFYQTAQHHRRQPSSYFPPRDWNLFSLVFNLSLISYSWTLWPFCHMFLWIPCSVAVYTIPVLSSKCWNTVSTLHYFLTDTETFFFGCVHRSWQVTPWGRVGGGASTRHTTWRYMSYNMAQWRSCRKPYAEEDERNFVIERLQCFSTQAIYIYRLILNSEINRLKTLSVILFPVLLLLGAGVAQSV